MILQIQHINKHYGAHHVVKDLNLNIEEGEFLTLLGPSGCGKTTILRMIGGFETPSSGNISLLSKDITQLPPYKRLVNTVFQNYALFPNMTVGENIAFGCFRFKIEKVNAVRIKISAKNAKQNLCLRNSRPRRSLNHV